MKKSTLILLLYWLPLLVRGGQFDDVRTHHFSEVNGLSSNQVYAFAQDKNGMMWIGTGNGLNRFDGNNFKVFRKDFANENSVRDNMIMKVVVDGHNNVWIGYGSGGISCYNQTTRIFKHYLPDPSNPNAILYGSVDGLGVDSKNRIWIGIALKGLSCFDPVSEKFTNYGLLPTTVKGRSQSSRQHFNRITQIEIDKQDVLWMATGDGFYSFNSVTGAWKEYEVEDSESAPEDWKPDVFNTLYRTGPDDFYLGGWGRGLNHCNIKTGKWENFLPNPSKPRNGTANIIASIHRKSDHELWVTSADTGLLAFDLITKKFSSLPVVVGTRNNLPVSNLGMMYEDRNGDLWLAHGQGFHIFEQGKTEFSFTKLPVSFSGNGEYYRITSTLTDPLTGKLLIATDYADGLNVLDATGKQEHHLFEVSEADDSVFIMNELFLDSRNTIWAGTYDFLFQFDRKADKLVKIRQPVPDTSFKYAPYYAQFAEGPDGKVWISTFRNGIYVYDYKSDSYSQLFHHKDNPNSLLSNTVTGISIDKSGKVWIAYKADGVSSYEPATGKFIHYVYDRKNPKSLIDNRVYGLACDQFGQVWIGTGSGLVVIDTTCKPGEVQRFVKDQQMLGILVSDLKFDKSGKLWFVNTRGFSVFNPANKQLKNYSISNGLYSIFESLSIHEHYTGELFLGTFSGYYRFNPEIANVKERPGKVLITNFMIGEREIPYESELASKNRIELSPADNFFSIEFNTINFLNPVGIVYYYRLSDEQWKQIPRKGYASYSHLPGGDYVFEVKVMNASGEFSDVTRLPIHIQTPFYKTPVFSIFMILMVSGAIFLLYRYRIREIEKTEAIKTHFNKQLAETEMRALRAQMNPHFIFNCLNSINRYIIKNDQKTASLYLTKFAKLIRLILDNSEQHVVALSQDLEALKLYIEIEALRFDYKFSFEIDVDSKVFPDTILVPSMLIQPFVENAIWHGLLHKEVPGRLTIRVFRDPGMLVVEVADDGVGRQKAQEMKSKSATTRKSLGLKITADRLKMLHNHSGQQGSIEYIDLTNETGGPAGTLVKIKIPVDDEK